MAFQLDRNKGNNKVQADHIGAYNFSVEIEGVAAGFFKGVDGLNTEIEVIEYQDGDDLLLRKRPGRTKFGDVTLKKGHVANPELLKWWKDTVAGKVTRKTVTIKLKDNVGEDVQIWTLFESWIKKWSVNGFDGKGNDVVTEEIVLVCEHIELT